MATFARGFWSKKTNHHNGILRKRLDRQIPDPIPSNRQISEAFTRDKIILQLLSRDGHHCYLCGAQQDPLEYELDHVIPRAHGGTDQLRNLALTCQSCNRRKRDYIVAIRISDRMPCYTYADTSRYL